MQRVILTLPEDMLEEVDSLARRHQQNRSQLIRQALHDLLERERQAEFEALLAEGYQAHAAELAQAAIDAEAAQAMAADGLWVWDE
jgi:CopG family transcriptional regulator/antitoxin EndoAI